MLHRVKSRDVSKTHAGSDPSVTSAEQTGQSVPPVDVSHRSSLKFFASSTTTNRSKGVSNPYRDWKAEYLNDLRSNRPVRPSGSRPIPGRYSTDSTAVDLEPPVRTASALARPIHPSNGTDLSDINSPPRSSSAMSHRRVQSTLSNTPNVAIGGRPLVQQPHSRGSGRDFSASTTASSNSTIGNYRESGHRWMEKQEAHSLREALEDMDLKEQQRLHSAAQDEASDLVWKHRNPEMPYRNPDAPDKYRQHLLKGAHGRSQSGGPHPSMNFSSPLNTQAHRSSSGDSYSETTHSRVSSQSSRVATGAIPKQTEQKTDHAQQPVGKGHALWDSPQKKAYMNLKFSLPSSLASHRRRSSGQRSREVSGEDGKGLFRNPKDQIYEEPEELDQDSKRGSHAIIARSAPLHSKSRNSSAKVHFARDSTEFSKAATGIETMKLSSCDIHRNPPTKSRDPSYVSNPMPPTPPDSGSASENDLNGAADRPTMINGIEVRSDEIRAATSMRLKDRSAKLPTPTVVSDRPGRPIVSFDRDWKPKDIVAKQEAVQGTRRVSRDSLNKALPTLPDKARTLESTASAPVVPTINLPEPPEIQVTTASTPLIPTINVPDSASIAQPSVPSISAPDTRSSPRPLPVPQVKGSKGRPLPHHSSTAPVKGSKSAWSPLFARRPTAQCAQCALPIAGRIVSAANQRFHPECFVCYHCNEALECVAFYPEPDGKREERVARIRARANGESLEESEGMGELEDGDEGLRFYCHLDFHEFFSPRCRSCKTPIEGEVVVACGGEWHIGHFFCAECGDVSCQP